MATDIDICNLALGHLGDDASLTSLSPPSGTIQAEHCARFYPIARDTLLEMHAWGFATKRVTLTSVSNTWPQWDYAYTQPADALNLLAVLPPDSTDDYTERAVDPMAYGLSSLSQPPLNMGRYVPQPFSSEVDASGTPIIYSDQKDAVLRYTARITDTTKYSPLFVMALSWHLASMLAGPVIKGDAGAAEAKRCAQMMAMFLNQAKASDANQRKANLQHTVSWMAGR